MNSWPHLHNILKKSLYILIIILFSITISAFVHAEMVTICEQECDYTSITTAINAANPGDILEVYGGTYRENIDIGKPMILKGLDIGQGKPVIDAGGKGSAITLSSNGVTLDGFNVTNSLGSLTGILAGIRIKSNNNTIRENIAFNNENGILLTDSSNNTIKNNIATNNNYGIKVENADGNDIMTNDLNNNIYGLYIISSENNEIKQNNAFNNDFGIQINKSSGNTLTDNMMHENSYNFGADGKNNIETSNLVDGKPIYYLVGASGKTIDSSSHAGTVYCIDCRNVTIKDLALKNNFYGIFLINTTHSLVKDNQIFDNRNGIMLFVSNRNSVEANNVSHNSAGIYLASSRYNSVMRNMAQDNDNAGLLVANSNYNDIINNEACKGQNGFHIFNSGSNTVAANNLSENLVGLYLESAWLNDLLNNGISHNSKGILLESSAENRVIGNNISDNFIGLLFDPLNNNTLASNLMLSNQKNQEEILINPTAQPPGTGPSISIYIKSKPEGATIKKDGEFSGKTPRDAYFIEPGDHILVLSLEGYKDRELHISIPAEKNEIVADLLPDD